MARFGKVEFDCEHGRLRVGGRPVDLDRACTAILALLFREMDKDVSKDRLLEAGWPGRVIHENSLAKAILRIRQALGEDAGALETVHGYGYRLTSRPVTADRVEQAGRPSRVGWRGAIAVLGILAPTGLAAAWFGSLSADRPLIKGEPADAIGRVLWVDDNPQNNFQERKYLERRKVAVYQVKTTEEALALLSMYEYDAVISDMNRNDKPLDGLTLVREMRRRGDTTLYFVYTVVPSAAQNTLVIQAGGQGAVVTSSELYAALLPIFGDEAASLAP